MFKFPPSIFQGLTYVDKPAADLQDGEACWHKEDRSPEGQYRKYRLTIRLHGRTADSAVSRMEFLAAVADKRGEEYVSGLVSSLLAEVAADAN